MQDGDKLCESMKEIPLIFQVRSFTDIVKHGESKFVSNFSISPRLYFNNAGYSAQLLISHRHWYYLFYFIYLRVLLTAQIFCRCCIWGSTCHLYGHQNSGMIQKNEIQCDIHELIYISSKPWIYDVHTMSWWNGVLNFSGTTESNLKVIHLRAREKINT